MLVRLCGFLRSGGRVDPIGGRTVNEPAPVRRLFLLVRALESFPSLREKMSRLLQGLLAEQTGRLLIDGMVTYTGDDIALLMSHTKGAGAPEVHQFAWSCFLEATEIARAEGAYAAGQDLLVDAPSGNVRGAGPGVAEIEFERDDRSDYRPAEAFMVFAGDKCAPGAYNLPLYLAFCDPMHNGGLLLSPRLHLGFTLTIIDMDYRGDDGLGFAPYVAVSQRLGRVRWALNLGYAFRRSATVDGLAIDDGLRGRVGLAVSVARTVGLAATLSAATAADCVIASSRGGASSTARS
jgi:hypothetical protein